MGNMRKLEGKITVKDILFLVLFLTLLAIPIYFAYTILFPRVEIFDVDDKEEEVEQIEEEEEKYEGPHYEEINETIEGENAYIAVPTRMDSKNPPRIVIYSHGSNTTVTFEPEDDLTKALHTYGEFFTQQNMIFAASNQHGANWGNNLAIQDTLNLIEWIQQKYNTREKVNMIGFSMGGLPTMNFTAKYPDKVYKVALLAPTTRSTDWNSERVEKIKDIDIKIWHGTQDVNVSYSLSPMFVEKLAEFEKYILLETLEGKTHWDLDTQYMDEILQFFNQ